MRENGLLVHQRTSMHPGPKAHDGSIIPDDINEMWGTDMTKAFTRNQGWVSVFGAVDHFSAECAGLHAAKRGTRFEALEPIRQGIKDNFGVFAEDVALGLTMRHDCGSQYTSDDFQDELAFLGIEASPAFVRSPECNGCIERFFRTLKENLLWVREFEDIEDLNEALQEFKERYNSEWLIARHNYRTPNQVKEQCMASLKEAA
jgi:transposase InsO family protein